MDVAGNTITFNREVEEVISNTYLYPHGSVDNELTAYAGNSVLRLR